MRNKIKLTKVKFIMQNGLIHPHKTTGVSKTLRVYCIQFLSK